MKSLLLYICSLLFFCATPAMEESNDIPEKNDNRPLQNDNNIEYGFISADGQSSQAYVSNQYIACKVSRVHNAKSYIKILLSSPFIMNDHPQAIKNRLFFDVFLTYENKLLYVPQKSELLVDTIEKTVWCFEKKENRNLNYKIYLAPFYNCMESSLKYILKTDLILFSPYFEKDGESYILTWNPIDSVQNPVKADKRSILFPISGEQGVRPGVIVSPLLFYNFNGYYVYIAGHIGDCKIVANLMHKIKDEQGRVWVLSWRKVDKKTLQEHSKSYPYVIQQ